MQRTEAFGFAFEEMREGARVAFEEERARVGFNTLGVVDTTATDSAAIGDADGFAEVGGEGGFDFVVEGVGHI